MFLALELCLSAIGLALAYTRPNLGERWFGGIEKWLNVLAERRIIAIVSVGALALGLRVALLPILPIPAPETHDEYSYLLLADTFAHGRLANPSHPMWTHFETFHVNWHPTYASMYYPGQGIFLAFGQVALGNPFWGVWLSAGLMCAAICWALQGWMPAGWALFGGFVAVIRLGTLSYWDNSYWGGAVPALGGALVIGALPRIKEFGRARDAVLMSFGMALLANTRPYEGLFFCAPVIAALLIWLVRQNSEKLRSSLVHVIMPAAVVIAITLGFMAYYFWRVTGNPLTTPYQINMRTYGLVYFPWQKIVAVQEFHHTVMQQLYRGGAVVGMYNYAHHHPLQLQFFKFLVVWLFYAGPLITVPWLVWLFTRPHRKFWNSFTPQFSLVLLVCSMTCFSLALTIYIGQPHYAAPATAAFYIVTFLIMRDLFQSPITPYGKLLVRSVALICVLLFIFRVITPALNLTPASSWIRTWCSQDPQNLRRAQVLNVLENRPGQHLVIVRYRPDHDFILDEWVFNNADIDESKVIWARDMGVHNEELTQYFKARHVWLAEPDYNPPKLSPYAE